MFSTKTRFATAITLTLLGGLALSACSSSGMSTDTAEKPAATSEASSAPTTDDKAEDTMADPAANLVGPACAAYAETVPDGAGSIQGMSQDPVAVAASNNPLLKTLVAAVSGQLNPNVDLVSTLNGDEFTVFAPVDDAFAKIDAATIDKLKTDTDLLTKILTYHVVPGQIEPADIVGMQKTVEGQEVTVAGSGDALTVNGANVLCGGVQTANATVYLVDSVLMPPAE